MTRVYFGTDGVRGVYGGPVINESFAARLGFAAATWLPRKGPVLVGRDTRFSGAALEAAVRRGFRAAGLESTSLGVLPTPAVARAVRVEGAALGVVITASHNPAADNGIKFFGPGGVKLTDEQELSIECALPSSDESGSQSEDGENGSAGRANADYIAAAQRLLSAGALRGWKIVLDTANGATCTTTSRRARGSTASRVASRIAAWPAQGS